MIDEHTMNLMEIDNSSERNSIVKFSKLKKRIEWAKEGHFLDILMGDPVMEVRLEVAKSGYYLWELKNDDCFEVRLAVLNMTSIGFMELDNEADLMKEPIEIIRAVIAKGFPTEKLIHSDSWQVRLEIVKAKGYQFCKDNLIINNIMDQHPEIQKEFLKSGIEIKVGSLCMDAAYKYVELKAQKEVEKMLKEKDDKNLKKHAILHGFKVENYNEEIIFKELDFCFKCIKKGVSLICIASIHSENEEIFKEFLRNKHYQIYMIMDGKSKTIKEHYTRNITVERANIVYETSKDLFNKFPEAKELIDKEKKTKMVIASKNIISI